MLYAQLLNGQIEAYGTLSSLFPNTSFPEVGPGEDWLTQNNVQPIVSIKPYDKETQDLVPSAPYIEDGIVYNVLVQAKDQQELDNERYNTVVNALVNENQAVIETLTEEEKVKYLDLAKSCVRTRRNRYLSDSDWTQLPDAPVDQTAWATYRQELRDVTAQTGFPWEINWPVEPS